MSAPQNLTPENIRALSSGYIQEGRKSESWTFTEILVQKDLVVGRVRMTEFFASPSDEGKFHLSFITAMEIMAQISVIYLHHQAGLQEKCKEVWISKSAEKYIRPIRDPETIVMEMAVRKLRSRGGRAFCEADYYLRDELGGLVEGWGKTVLE